MPPYASRLQLSLHYSASKNPVGPIHVLSTGKSPSGNWQGMAAKPKLQKPLHAPARNREMTIVPTFFVARPKPLVISAADYPNRWSCPRAVQVKVSVSMSVKAP